MRRSTQRLVLAGSIAILIVFQRWAGKNTTGDARRLVGFIASCGFLLLILGLGVTSGRVDASNPRDEDRINRRWLGFILAALLACNALGATLAPILSIRRVAPPIDALAAMSLIWIGTVLWIRLQTRSTLGLAAAFAVLIVSTRLLVVSAWPFAKLDGDMLATIDKALGELFAGRFPYKDYPPPMPYMPATFLAYAPAFICGIDLRLTNLVIDAVAVASVVLMVPRGSRRSAKGSASTSRPHIEQVLLPCFMLHPLWVNYSANSQLSPSLLAATLIGLTVVRCDYTMQAIVLGLAVGTNQTLGACAPILFAHWIGRGGLMTAIRLAMVSAACLLLPVLPFVLWHPDQFLKTILMSRPVLPIDALAGQFSLLPLVSGIVPHAGLVGTLAAIAVTSGFAFKTNNPSVVATLMALGLTMSLMFQPVSFSHYFLPVIPLVLVTPGDGPSLEDSQGSSNSADSPSSDERDDR